MVEEMVINVDNVTVGYGERIVLCDVSMRVMRGQVHVLVGGSGCGKSTLLKNIIGLAQPMAGIITVLGEETSSINNESAHLLSQRIGILFQGGALLGSLDIYDNVALPLREHTNLTEELISDVVGSMLAVVGLHDAHRMLPEELSGGMRKRAALARAMVMGPELLICDEPSAGLDPITAAGIDQLIINLRDRFGMTVLIITHELSSIEAIADTITMLHSGNIIFDGTPKQVQASTIPEVRAFFDRIPAQQTHTNSIFAEIMRGKAS